MKCSFQSKAYYQIVVKDEYCFKTKVMGIILITRHGNLKDGK